MNSDLYFDGKKYISSSRAAKISGYVNDYIGQLCRDGKLECRMVGRSWYVSLESLTQHKNTYGISTRSKGSKKGTSPVSAIVEVVSALSPKIEQEGLSNFADEFTVVQTDLTTVKAHEVIIPTQSLPEVFSINRSYPVFNWASKIVDQESVFIPIRVIATSSVHEVAPIAPVFVVSPLVSFPEFEVFDVLSTSHTVSTPEAILISERTIRSPYQVVRIAAGVCALFFAILGFRFGLSVSPSSQGEYSAVMSSVSQALPVNVFATLGNSLGSGALAVYTQLRSWIMDSRQTIFVLSGASPPDRTGMQTSSDSPVIPPAPSQGMVVVPITPDTNQKAVVAEVKNTFSDEVNVKQSDGESGVITPVFKKAKGNDYLYVLVPIQK